MSATSPAIHLEPRAASKQRDVRATLFRLALRRRLWRAAVWMTWSAAVALGLLCLCGALDYLLPLPRFARIAVAVSLLSGLLLISAQTLWRLLRRPALVSAAREIERAAGTDGRNALVTLCEQLEGEMKARGAAYMHARLSKQAERELTAIDERRVAPRGNARRGALVLALMLLVVLASRVLAPSAFAREAQRLLLFARDETTAPGAGANLIGARMDATGDGAVTIEELRVRVVPPAYTGLGADEVSGDAPVRALAGSRIEVTLRARGPVAGASLSFNGVEAGMRALGEGSFGGSFIAAASGALETRVLADERFAPAPLVRAVEVYADAPPEAHITEPGGDRLLRSVPAEAVGVRWTARDDLGLADVALKYIKSHGEGDAAKFTNGEVVLSNIERAGPREWRGTAALDLSRLGVQAGDTLVFWIEARDRNPSANGTGRSASLAIAIRAPEAARLNLGDLLPNEIGRFLLSERQIIIKTEKLHAERPRLAQDELVRRASDIAADQRDFKNSFDDYIKIEGAGEDESASAGKTERSVEEQVRAAEDERTATHFHGIPEPPQGAPASVREMVYAIRAMWDAEDALSAGDTTRALVHEREALTRLKRAQASVRYIPPIVARSKPVDLKRRYAGELTEIKTRLERLARRPQAKDAAPLRAALADVYAALGELQGTLDAEAGGRASATQRARERSVRAADVLVRVGGDHAATIAEAVGQLRIVETELARLETGGTSAEFAARVSRPLALLAQAAANLFAIADSSTRAGGSDDAGALLSTDDTRAAEYFRRLGGR